MDVNQAVNARHDAATLSIECSHQRHKAAWIFIINSVCVSVCVTDIQVPVLGQESVFL